MAFCRSLQTKKGVKTKMSLNEETEKDIVLLLRAVYDRANWKTIGRRSYALDVFSHKIKAAAYESSIPRFLDKLCYSLGVQSIDVDSALVKKLDSLTPVICEYCGHQTGSNMVLKALAKETVYYVLLVAEVKI